MLPVAGHEGKLATCRSRPDVDERHRRVHYRDVGPSRNLERAIIKHGEISDDNHVTVRLKTDAFSRTTNFSCTSSPFVPLSSLFRNFENKEINKKPISWSSSRTRLLYECMSFSLFYTVYCIPGTVSANLSHEFLTIYTYPRSSRTTRVWRHGACDGNMRQQAPKNISRLRKTKWKKWPFMFHANVKRMAALSYLTYPAKSISRLSINCNCLLSYFIITI